MSEGGKPREVIAHFEIVRLAISIVLWCLLAWFWISLKHSAFDDPATAHRARLVMGAILVPVILIILAVAIVRRVRMGWANRWAALWIEDGRLVYAHRKTLNVALGDVSSVGSATDYFEYPRLFLRFRQEIIAVVLRSGGQVKLSANSFREPRDEIVSRIREKIVNPA